MINSPLKFHLLRNGVEILVYYLAKGRFIISPLRAHAPDLPAAKVRQGRAELQDGLIVIGNPLVNSPPDFPSLQTVHESFPSHGFPSFTNCHSNQQQGFVVCSNIIASFPASFLSLFSLSNWVLFNCTVCIIAEIVSFCVA